MSNFISLRYLGNTSNTVGGRTPPLGMPQKEKGVFEKEYANPMRVDLVRSSHSPASFSVAFPPAAPTQLRRASSAGW